MNKRIPLSVPYIAGNEWRYVNNCLSTSWVSTAGKYVDLFENKVAEFTQSKYAVSCINGTSALHTCLLLSGVKDGDEVIMPTISFIAPANAISYCGAKPIFMDADDNYCIDIKKTIEFIKQNTFFKNKHSFNKKTKKRISALIVVHVYGRSVQLDELITVCKSRNIKIVEDAAESFGNFYLKGKYKKKHTGTVGLFGCLSFNGNKIITTGGGGMILTNSKRLAQKAKYLTTTAKDDSVQFIHKEVGYNYRITNLQAAMGLAQLEKIKLFLKKKEHAYLSYKKYFSKNKNVQFKDLPNNATSNYWLNLVEFKNISKKNDLIKIIKYLNRNNIEARPIWYLNHLQNKFKKCQKFNIKNATKLVKRTLCLPSSVSITNSEIKKVVSIING